MPLVPSCRPKAAGMAPEISLTRRGAYAGMFAWSGGELPPGAMPTALSGHGFDFTRSGILAAAIANRAAMARSVSRRGLPRWSRTNPPPCTRFTANRVVVDEVHSEADGRRLNHFAVHQIRNSRFAPIAI